MLSCGAHSAYTCYVFGLYTRRDNKVETYIIQLTSKHMHGRSLYHGSRRGLLSITIRALRATRMARRLGRFEAVHVVAAHSFTASSLLRGRGGRGGRGSRGGRGTALERLDLQASEAPTRRCGERALAQEQRQLRAQRLHVRQRTQGRGGRVCHRCGELVRRQPCWQRRRGGDGGGDGGGVCAHLQVEPRLRAGSSVLVQDATLDILVDDRKSLGKSRHRNRVVAQLRRLQHLDAKEHRRGGMRRQ